MHFPKLDKDVLVRTILAGLMEPAANPAGPEARAEAVAASLMALLAPILDAYSYPYARPSVTATIFAFHPFKGLLVGRRGQEVDAYPDAWCAPGGFLDAKREAVGSKPAHPGETIEQAAVRELLEETGIEIGPWRLKLFHVHSSPDTDPRAHVINICYVVMLSDDEARIAEMKGVDHDDLGLLDFFRPERIRIGEDEWAFNHHSLAKLALDWAVDRGLD